MDVAFIRRTRTYLRTEITKTFNRVNANLDDLSTIERKNILARLSEIQCEVKEYDRQISCDLFKSEVADSEIDKEFECCSEYNHKLIATRTLLESTDSVASNGAEYSQGREAPSRLKLPQLPLPEYSHAPGEDLNKFFSSFENTIGKYTLSSFEKYVFLKRQLRNEPLTLINSLEACKHNYESAKELLTKAFASPLTQQYDVLRLLSEMKLGNTDSPYDYISKMRVISDSFKNLKISTDLVLQYFFWHGMNPRMQEIFIQATNKNKPSLEEINEHVFEVTERYISANAPKKSGRSDVKSTICHETANLAINIKPKSSSSNTPFCSLCTGRGDKIVSHATYHCSIYPTVAEKRERLRSLNGCVKCGNISHPTNQCRFRFHKKCSNCSQWHFAFLCDSPTDDVGRVLSTSSPASRTKQGSSPTIAAQTHSKSTKINKPKGEIHSGLLIVEDVCALQVQYGEDSLIPTFSVTHPSGIVFRGLRDSGCQASFITESLVQELNLEPVNAGSELIVHGFNSSESYPLKVVDLKIFEEETPVRAICVPEIRTKVDLKDTALIVKGFNDAKITLADKFLLRDVTRNQKIDFILGNNDAHVLPITDVKFGDNPSSIYSCTKLGAMLTGSINRMLKNLSHLTKDLPQRTIVALAEIEGSCLADPKDSMIEALADTDIHTCHSSNIDPKIVDKAVDDILKGNSSPAMIYDSEMYEESDVETDQLLVKFVQTRTERDENGRLIMPLLWNDRSSPLLSNNYELAKNVLKSNLKRFRNDPARLEQYNDVFEEQEKSGVIEKIDDLPTFLKENPTCSFLPHMGVFKPDRETTKCRVVFLSNLCEATSGVDKKISHNQAMHCGPNLNKSLSTSIILLRFDRLVMGFDLKKAFLSIGLKPHDQVKLLFLWYRNVAKNDFTLVAYKHLRLAFGLRCSPTLLMLALHKILIVDSESDYQDLKLLKQLVYDLIYMDNGCITANDANELRWAHKQLPKIFDPYQFFVQQFVTNDSSLQREIDVLSECETPQKVKLLGLVWDRASDKLSIKPLRLDNDARTKRQLLSSLASNFDLFQFGGPTLNRARLFIHKLQRDASIGWDDKLSPDVCKEWRKICKQTNHSPALEVDRFVGRRDGNFQLIAFTDASKLMFGTVIYIRDTTSGKLNFLTAKNRIVNRQLETKTIPSLEFHAIALGTETLMEMYDDLAGDKCVNKIKIDSLTLFSDSLVALNWINSKVHKLDKMQKKSAFVLNRLETICKLCDKHPVTFSYVSGLHNPADCITRPVSYAQLMKSNYFSGPPQLAEMLDTPAAEDFLSFVVPSPYTQSVCANSCAVIPVENYSSFRRLVRVNKYVLKFVAALKLAIKRKNSSTNVSFSTEAETATNFYKESCENLIRIDQRKNFPEISEFFEQKSPALKNFPDLLTRLNIFRDKTGLLRVRSKFGRWKENAMHKFPILLAKDSKLTSLIISDLHKRFNHAGIYSVLAELRKEFYVPQHFSTVKRVLQNCIHCKRMNARPVKLNQSSYREFRAEPPMMPFRSIFVDHFGPFRVRTETGQRKVWILCVTCLYTRAVNLKVCLDLSVVEFLRTFQLHIFDHGMPELILSDLGTQLIAGGNIIADLIKDPESQLFLEEKGIRTVKFTQYAKGNSSLGSLVEICVKMTKRLIHGAIGRNVIKLPHFELVVAQAVHLVNKRPVAFKEVLRDESGRSDDTTLPAPITPEMLLRGYELVSMNVIPQDDDSLNPEWQSQPSTAAKIRQGFSKLCKIRTKLAKIYKSQFLPQLISQAVDRKDLYKPVKHVKLRRGDVVLLKESNCKAINYPMAVVKQTFENELNEVTSVLLMKGSNRELVKRHVSSVIPLIVSSEFVPAAAETSNHMSADDAQQSPADMPMRPQRAASRVATARLKQLFRAD